jgi:hypothetical protein
MWRRLLLALALIASACADQADDDALLAHVRSHGGVVHFAIGRDAAAGVRGAAADRPLTAGDLIASVPFALAVRLSNAATPWDAAAELLRRIHGAPAFNATHAALLAAQPGADSLFSPEMFTDAHIAALQAPELAALVRRDRAAAEQAYAALPPALRVATSIGEFKRWVALVATRTFEFAGPGAAAAGAESNSWLIPALDMVNHSEQPSVERAEEGTAVVLRALRPLALGEAVTMRYSDGYIHRPDMALLLYAFVSEEEDSSEEGSAEGTSEGDAGGAPLLASIDLPGFDPGAPYAPTPARDAAPAGPRAARAEAARLAARLAALPMREGADAAAAAAAAAAGDWRGALLARFRARRKAALRLRVARLYAGRDEL